jgi:nucleoside-diphosphate-sugar epimerase
MTDQPGTSGMAPHTRTVLITGNDPVLGRSIAARLGRPLSAERTTIITIGPPNRSTAGPDACSHAGNLAAPRFGLQHRDYRELVGQVDAVVHLSSSSTFIASAADDVTRTRRVLDFVEQSGAPLYWVGSAFGTTGGRHRHHRRTGWLSEDSRLMVESLLRTSAPQSVVVRPSIVIGDSRTGAIAAFPGVYRVLAAMLVQGARPIIPVDLGLRLDLMPCDLVADVIARLIRNRVTDREVWLTMGERALTIEQVHRLLQTFAAEAGWDLPAPWLEPAQGGRQRDEPFPQALTSAQRRVVTSLMDLFADQLVHDEPLQSSLGDQFANSLSELGALGVEPLPEPDSTLLASLRYWRRVTQGRRDCRWADLRGGWVQDAVA